MRYRDWILLYEELIPLGKYSHRDGVIRSYSARDYRECFALYTEFEEAGGDPREFLLDTINRGPAGDHNNQILCCSPPGGASYRRYTND